MKYFHFNPPGHEPLHQTDLGEQKIRPHPACLALPVSAGLGEDSDQAQPVRDLHLELTDLRPPDDVLGRPVEGEELDCGLARQFLYGREQSYHGSEAGACSQEVVLAVCSERDRAEQEVSLGVAHTDGVPQVQLSQPVRVDFDQELQTLLSLLAALQQRNHRRVAPSDLHTLQS